MGNELGFEKLSIYVPQKELVERPGERLMKLGRRRGEPPYRRDDPAVRPACGERDVEFCAVWDDGGVAANLLAPQWTLHLPVHANLPGRDGDRFCEACPGDGCRGGKRKGSNPVGLLPSSLPRLLCATGGRRHRSPGDPSGPGRG